MKNDSKKKAWILAAALLGVCVVVSFKTLLKERTQSNLASSDVPYSASRLMTESSNTFKIISETLTSTGKVYVIQKGAISNTVNVPLTMEISPEDLETLLNTTLSTNNPPVRAPGAGLNRELVFYGIALDEKTNAVPSVLVEANVLVMSPEGSMDGRRIVQARSGEDGRFTLQVPWGQQMMLTVKGPTNYINPEPQWFQYAHSGNRPIHRPDLLNPVVFLFHIRQKEEPLFSFQQRYRAPHDGQPVRVDLTTGRLVQSGGDLLVSIRVPEPFTNMRQYPWSLEVSAVDGGLLKTGGRDTRMEHLHQAPEGGYEDGFFVEHQENSSNYDRQFEGWFFVRSRNGQVFAKLYFDMTTRWDERGVPFGIRAVVNTNGSRYLHTEPR